MTMAAYNTPTRRFLGDSPPPGGGPWLAVALLALVAIAPACGGKDDPLPDASAAGAGVGGGGGAPSEAPESERLDLWQGVGSGLLLRGGFAYWLARSSTESAATLRRKPIAGGKTEVLLGDIAAAYSITEAAIYYERGGNLHRADLDGGASALVSEAPAAGAELSAMGYQGEQIFRAHRAAKARGIDALSGTDVNSGDMAELIAPFAVFRVGYGDAAFHVSSHGLTWVDDQSLEVLRAGLDGTDVETLHPGDPSHGPAVGGGDEAYYLAPPALYRALPDGGSETVLRDDVGELGLGEVCGIVAEGNHVYLAGARPRGAQAIVRVDPDGGTELVVETGGIVCSVAVDERHVYFVVNHITEGTASLRRIEK
jgi:hypothetical protein